MIHDRTLPTACSTAFKEWAGVCEAIGQGRQSLILRKGGVSEGLAGFQPEFSTFWLYPTHVHEAEQGLRQPVSSPAVEMLPGEVAIETLVVVEWLGRVERVDQLLAMSDLHGWTESTVLGRFHYRRPGLWAMAVRAYRRAAPWRLAITPSDLGCKTWVPLESSMTTDGLTPALVDDESARRVDLIRSRVEG